MFIQEISIIITQVCQKLQLVGPVQQLRCLHLMNTVENFTTIYLQLTYYRCVGSCNNLNDLSNNVCVSNKTEDLNLSVFEMITRVNKSKTLAKHISGKFKCRFDGRKCNSNQWWNNNKC